MQDNSAEKEQGSIWGRLLFMILFAIIFSVGETVVYITALVAFLTRIFTGAVNESVRGFGANLATYLSQVVRYLTFNTEVQPFPFTPWPSQRDNLTAEPQRESFSQTKQGEPAAQDTGTPARSANAPASPGQGSAPKSEQAAQSKPETESVE